MDLSTLTTHAQRLGARLSENLAERSKDLGLPLSLDALSNPTSAIGMAAGPGKGMWDDAKLLTAEGDRETRRLLESRTEREREDGLRRVMALMCKGRPVLAFFPLVTNCLHSSTFTTTSAAPTASLTTRQLVSAYIVRHAASSPDLALLSVNAWQKDLTDPNPAIRALALRTLAGMHLDTVGPLVVMSVTRAVRDGNWWVRKAAAEALVAVHRLDPASHGPALISGPLPILLADRSPLVIGPALEAWSAVCPGRYDLLHQHYRRFCRMLVDADEWGQIVAMRILTRYARLYLRDPNRSGGEKVDSDLEILLRSAQILLQSHNPATVLATVHLFCFLAPSQRLSIIAEPLIAMIRAPASEELLHVALNDILTVAESRPDLFAPYLPNLFIFTSDSAPVKSTKLQIMLLLTNRTVAPMVMSELEHYAKDHEAAFAGQAVAGIAQIAINAPEVSSDATRALIGHCKSSSPGVIAEAVQALRRLLGHPSLSASRAPILARLSRLLVHGHIQSSPARATIYGLVAQFAADEQADLLRAVAPDLLRVAVREFSTETTIGKVQILALSAKMLVLSHLASLSPHLRFYSSAFRYVATLARYDEDYMVRDRARFLAGLVDAAGIAAPQDQAKVTLTADAFARGEDLLSSPSGEGDGSQRKPQMGASIIRDILCAREQSVAGSKDIARSSARLGSLADLAGVHLHEPDMVPEWATSVPDPAIRDVDPSIPSPVPAVPALRGFGSETFTSLSMGGQGFSGRPASGRNSPVILTPTTREAARPVSAAASKGGYKDLSDFLGGNSDSDEGDDEDDEEEDEQGNEEESDDGAESQSAGSDEGDASEEGEDHA